MSGVYEFVDYLEPFEVIDLGSNESLSIYMMDNFMEMKISLNESSLALFNSKFQNASIKETFCSENEWFNINTNGIFKQLYCYFGLSSFNQVASYLFDFLESYLPISKTEHPQMDFRQINELANFVKTDPRISINISLYHMLSWNVEINYLDTKLEDSKFLPKFVHRKFRCGEFWNLRNFEENRKASVLLGEASKNKIEDLLNEIVRIFRAVYR